MNTGVAVVGAAESDLGVSDLPALALLAQGVTRALDDAGLALRDVDGLATSGTGRFPATQAAGYLGIAPAWTDSTFAGGSAFEMYVARAAQAIAAGQCATVVIAYGSDQRSRRSRSLTGPLDPAAPEAQFEAPAGPLYPLSHYAMAARRYLHVYGHSRRALAEVAVAARAWALLNPAAHRHGAGPLTVDDVLAAPMVSSPLTKADCCLVTDGGGAVVLTSLDRARDLRRPPVRVLGYGEATTHTGSAGPDDLLANPGAYASAARAYRRAGLTPADIDVTQVYDSFTITTLLTLEALGFCGPGEAADFVADGRIRPGGGFPLNTGGGGLSYGHPGMFGVFLLIEAVRQLRGECGPRQVPGARTAVAHGTGGILSTHATVVLARDDPCGPGTAPPGPPGPGRGPDPPRPREGPLPAPLDEPVRQPEVPPPGGPSRTASDDPVPSPEPRQRWDGPLPAPSGDPVPGPETRQRWDGRLPAACGDTVPETRQRWDGPLPAPSGDPVPGPETRQWWDGRLPAACGDTVPGPEPRLRWDGRLPAACGDSVPGPGPRQRWDGPPPAPADEGRVGTQVPPWDGPLPAPADAVTRPWWDATRVGRLTVQRCDGCRTAQHPPRVLCTGCGATHGLRLLPVAATAVLDTFTVVHRAPSDRPLPYALGRIRLAEGPVLLAPLEGDHEALRCGQSLRLNWRTLPDGRMLPAFHPAGDAADLSAAARPGPPITDPPHAAPAPPSEPEP
ncbi:acetyl-CoA acetyltransferase [Streptomyces sp. NBC_00358]|uniref:acetyl-CoA acetyltransferase n=1 Tax=Streptomyces sp. NBC_00358 TaxID=2975725 RepID=UPI002E25E1CD